jgi:NADPH-dependent curcumin reductase CurA
VDVYFETVGGATLLSVLPQMNIGGRIAVIGMIAWFSGANIGSADPASGDVAHDPDPAVESAGADCL